MYNLINSPRSIGKVLKDSWILYKAVFLKALLLAVIGAAIIGALLITSAIIVGVLDLMFDKQVLITWSPSMIGVFSAAIIISLICICFLLWLKMVMFRLEDGVAARRDQVFCDAFLVATKRFPVGLASAFLVLLIISIGFALIIIPGIYVTVLLAFFWAAIVVDNKKIFQSIKYSAQIVFGNWWRVFSVFVIVALVNIVINGPWNLLLKFGFHLSKEQLLFHLLGLIPYIFLIPWNIAINLELYHDLKCRYQLKIASKSEVH